MQEQRKILDIEKSLGFKWARGLSRQGESLLVPRLRELLRDVDLLKVKFVGLDRQQLWSSTSFKEQCEILFEIYGPDLWPPRSLDRTSWLVSSAVNEYHGLYPRDLCYFDDTDRET